MSNPFIELTNNKGMIVIDGVDINQIKSDYVKVKAQRAELLAVLQLIASDAIACPRKAAKEAIAKAVQP